MQKQRRTCTHTHKPLHTPRNTHVRAPRNMCTCTRTHTDTLTHTNMYTDPYTRTETHVHVHTHNPLHIPTKAHTHKHKDPYTLAHTLTHRNTCTCTHTGVHMCIHTHMHTLTHTETHVHTRAPPAQAAPHAERLLCAGSGPGAAVAAAGSARCQPPEVQPARGEKAAQRVLAPAELDPHRVPRGARARARLAQGHQQHPQPRHSHALAVPGRLTAPHFRPGLRQPRAPPSWAGHSLPVS